jgi:ABC-type transport system involved in cytochrome bd biosynthesis fused ATPase/permease subunit
MAPLVRTLAKRHAPLTAGRAVLELLARLPLLVLPLYWKWFTEVFLDGGLIAERGYWLASAWFGLVLVASLVSVASDLLGFLLAERVRCDLRNGLLDALPSHRAGTMRPGELATLLSGDLAAVEALIASHIPVLTAIGCGTLALGVILWTLNPAVFAGAFVCAVLLIPALRHLSRVSVAHADRAREESAAATGLMGELAKGRDELVSLGALDGMFREAVAGRMDRHALASRRSSLAGTWAGFVGKLGFGLVVAATILTLATQVASGTKSLSEVMAVMEIVIGAGALVMLTIHRERQPTSLALASARRLEEFMKCGAIAPAACADALVFEGARFAWGEREMLADLSLTVSRGEMVAICGVSGSGKTTLGRLAAGLLQPDGGRVRFPGRPLYIPQEPLVFTGTIRENLRLANPEASDARLIEVLRELELDQLVASLPLGLDTAVSPHCSLLSGGERQRLALARAFLTDSEVWILDEPTAALDAETERAVSGAISRHSAGRAVLLITHSDRLLQIVDRAYRLSEGGLEATTVGGEVATDDRALAAPG